MKPAYNKIKKYTGGRYIEIHPSANPDNAMKRLQRWMKEENMFVEMRESEFYDKPSSKRRKSKHLAKKRQEKKWRDLEDEFGPVKQKRSRTKSNRGKHTLRKDVK